MFKIAVITHCALVGGWMVQQHIYPVAPFSPSSQLDGISEGEINVFRASEKGVHAKRFMILLSCCCSYKCLFHGGRSITPQQSIENSMYKEIQIIQVLHRFVLLLLFDSRIINKHFLFIAIFDKFFFRFPIQVITSNSKTMWSRLQDAGVVAWPPVPVCVAGMLLCQRNNMHSPLSLTKQEETSICCEFFAVSPVPNLSNKGLIFLSKPLTGLVLAGPDFHI